MLRAPLKPPTDSNKHEVSSQQLSGLTNEMDRLRTFSSYVPPAGVFVVPLAASGFFLSFQNHNHDDSARLAQATVTCAFCHVVVTVSRFTGRQAASLHSELSPSCKFVGGENVGNMSVAEVGKVSSADFIQRYFLPADRLPPGTEIAQERVATNRQPQHHATDSPASSTDTPTLTGSQAAAVTQPQPSAASVPLQTVSGGTTRHVTSSSSPILPEVRGQSASTTAETDGDSGGSSSSGRGQETQLVTYEQLGIYSQRPKRPDMAVVQVRINTYDHWPHRDTHPPEEMAVAGFYYTGHEDLVRCFHCKGGLKTWEPLDRPWIEHTRWFPQCPYIKLCKGDKFVQAVQNLDNPDNSPAITDEDVLREVRRLEVRHLRPRMVFLNNRPEEPSSGDPNCDALARFHFGIEVIEASIEERAERLRTDNDQLASNMSCKICRNQDVQVLFLPCGHLVACAQCAPPISNCAVCRQLVKGNVRVYLDEQRDSEELFESQESAGDTG